MVIGMPSTKTNQAKSKTQIIEEILEPWVPPVLMGLLYDVKSFIAYQKFHCLIKNNIDLKNIHYNERCFIIGSGPSIKKQDLRPLRDEIVIPLNNFYVHPDFQEIMSGHCPKYYLTAPLHPPKTRNIWVKWLADISTYVPEHTKMIFGVNGYVDSAASIIKENNFFPENEIYWYLPTDRHIDKYGFSQRFIDIIQPVMISGTASVYALMFATYMGFKEIYLLGLDHSSICSKISSREVRFYSNALHQKEEKPPARINTFLNHRNIFLQYESIKNCTESKILNLSHSSLLDVFEFERIETILKQTSSF